MTKIQTSRHISGFEIANCLSIKNYLEEEFFQAIKALLSRPEAELSNGLTITISQEVGK